MAKHAEAAKVDYDNWCRCCAFYEFDDNRGILCGITREKPAFGAECATFEYDANRDRKSSTAAVKSRIKNNRKKIGKDLQESIDIILASEKKITNRLQEKLKKKKIANNRPI